MSYNIVMQNPDLVKITQDDPSWIWYSKNTSALSKERILEHVLNYGTWEQVQKSIAIHGQKKPAETYQQIANKPRTNLKPRVKNYFDLYSNRA